MHSVVCRRLSSSLTLPVAGRVGGRARPGGRHCTAGQYGYVLLGRHLVFIHIYVIAFYAFVIVCK